jgi:hypothetical protein
MLASAFVARWCISAKVETAGGVFRVREDEPTPRGAALRTDCPVMQLLLTLVRIEDVI